VAICYQNSFEFPSVKRRKIETNFEGGEIISDAGSILLNQVDKKIGLTRRVAQS